LSLEMPFRSIRCYHNRALGIYSTAELGTKQNFKKMPNFSIPLLILTWSRMLQEYFMKDSEHTFFGLGDYREQKKREKDAPYDNFFMSPNMVWRSK